MGTVGEPLACYHAYPDHWKNSSVLQPRAVVRPPPPDPTEEYGQFLPRHLGSSLGKHQSLSLDSFSILSMYSSIRPIPTVFPAKKFLLHTFAQVELPAGTASLIFLLQIPPS